MGRKGRNGQNGGKAGTPESQIGNKAGNSYSRPTNRCSPGAELCEARGPEDFGNARK